MSCAICLEDIIVKPKGPAPVTCAYCAETCCYSCFERHVLVQDLTVNCFNCRKPWSDDFVDNATRPSFRNGRLRAHRTKILVDQEIARLPELQERARRYTLVKQLAHKRVGGIDLSIMIVTYGREKSVNGYNLDRIAEVDQFFGNSEWRIGAGAEAPVRPKMLKPCIECRGFLGEDGVCGLCAVAVCLACRERLAEGHVCNPDTVATVAAIQKEAKPCPTCHALISKIDGCDQMWCTQCQTAFSWITGLKEEGRVHNPHYYEWMRATRGSVPRVCAEDDLMELPWDRIETGVFIDAERSQFFVGFLVQLHRYLEEARDHRYLTNNTYLLQQIDELSVRYLINQLSRKEWERQVYLTKRTIARYRAMAEIYRAYYVAGKDIMNAYLGQTISEKELIMQIVELQKYMDVAFKNCLKRYFYSGHAYRHIIPTSWYQIIGSGYDRDILLRIIDKEIDYHVEGVTVGDYERVVAWLTA